MLMWIMIVDMIFEDLEWFCRRLANGTNKARCPIFNFSLFGHLSEPESIMHWGYMVLKYLWTLGGPRFQLTWSLSIDLSLYWQYVHRKTSFGFFGGGGCVGSGGFGTDFDVSWLAFRFIKTLQIFPTCPWAVWNRSTWSIIKFLS